MRKSAQVLRRESRTLFPDWSVSMRAKWVAARLRVQRGTWIGAQIGEKYVPLDVPEFLRTLPRDGSPLVLAYDRRDHIQAAVRFVRKLVG